MDSRSYDNWTHRMCAAVNWRRVEVVRELLNHNPALKATNNEGRTVLMVAISGGIPGLPRHRENVAGCWRPRERGGQGR